MNEPFFDTWPMHVNGASIEPGSGQVRIKPVVGAPLWLNVADVRELAAAADSRRRAVLLAAAVEATRQESWMHEDMDGRTR